MTDQFEHNRAALSQQVSLRYALDAQQAEISSRLAQKPDRDLISSRPGPGTCVGTSDYATQVQEFIRGPTIRSQGWRTTPA